MSTKHPTISLAEDFRSKFENGFSFWTSEDGCRTDLLILREEKNSQSQDDEMDARMRLFREFWYLRGIDWSKRLVKGYVDWTELDKEWWDSTRAPRDRHGWMFSEGVTPYPVWHLSLC